MRFRPQPYTQRFESKPSAFQLALEAKRIAVREARGLDFIDAEILFDGRPLYTVPSPRGVEQRWLSVGELNGRLVAVFGHGEVRPSESS